MTCETERLTFMRNRDGQEELVKFAKQSMIAYRRTVLKGGFATMKENRLNYIRSYLEFKHTYLTGEIRFYDNDSKDFLREKESNDVQEKD